MSERFSSIAIVGVGLIGGSLAVALRRAGYAGRIVGVSREATLAEARKLGVIDEGYAYDRVVEAAREADLVVLCTPIFRLLELIEELGRSRDSLREGAVITDVGSTKGRIVEAARAAFPDRVTFVGGHPLAGSEHSGVANSDPFLFQNAYYVLTPTGSTEVESVDALAELLGTTGARVVLMDPATHDRVAAAISHLPQLLAVELVNSLDDLGEEKEIAKHLAAGGFRDMTRIAASPYSVWNDIYGTNSREVLDAVERFTDRVRAGAAGLDPEKLGPAFEKAALTRAEIPLDTKGFLRRLWNVMVEVTDTPGVIAHLAVPLADAGINIKDIEVLKVREGEGGTMRLAFATRDDAERALRILDQAGFRARMRG